MGCYVDLRDAILTAKLVQIMLSPSIDWSLGRMFGYARAM